jgi:DNA polymerase (family 10)
MSVNASLAERLALIGRMIELLGEDAFRANAHAKAARLIADMPEDLGALVRHAGPEAKKRLTALEGIGPKIADKIIEFVTSGRIGELDELQARVPAGLIPLLDIPGLGPKTVGMMWNQAGVKSLADLKRIIADGSILGLPRMGEKAVAKIKESIALIEQGRDRLPLGLARPIADRIVALLAGVEGVTRAEAAGSLRRGKETIGDIDVLICAASDRAAERASKAFVGMPGVTTVLASGPTRSSVRVAISPDVGRFESEGVSGDAYQGPSIQVDLRVIDEASWGAALLYFTGSKEHNVRLREDALKLGLTLNEYGLFPEDKAETPPQERGVKPVASRTEAEVYAALGLALIPPEMREDRGEIDAFSAKPRPGRKADARAAAPGHAVFSAGALVSLESIRSELHAHTTASDGAMSIVELASLAKSRGMHTVAVTDHSRSSVIAGGLSPERLRQHIRAVHAAREHVEGIRILAGSEVDILADGTLDYDDDLLAELDIVVASPHTALSQDSAAATRRLLKAVTHPLVHILGHPTGRLINRRTGLSPDMGELVSAAVEHRTALEINAHWLRLDLRDTHARLCADRGALIAIDCDTHAPEDMDNLRFGVMTARRGWVLAENVVNCWSAERLNAWLKSKR